MGCKIHYLLWLCEKSYIKKSTKILDIGEQCLLSYEGNLENIAKLRKIFDMLHVRQSEFADEAAYEAYLAECSWRSALIGHPTAPTLFLGDVLTKTSVEYVAIDICRARYAELFDLNVHSLAPDFHNYFDMVLNFGTTEHIINQYNCFKVMHEACKPGGYIHAQIPASGWVNHGYFNYDPLLFYDLATANNYIIHALWFNRGGGETCILDLNKELFPSVLDTSLLDNYPDNYALTTAPVLLVNVIYEKTSTKPFTLIAETRTSASPLTDITYSSKLIDKTSKNYSRFAVRYFSDILLRIPKPVKALFSKELKDSIKSTLLKQQ